MRKFSTILPLPLLAAAFLSPLLWSGSLLGQEQVSTWRLIDPTARQLAESIANDRQALGQLIESGQIPATETNGAFQLRPSPTSKPNKTARIRFEFPQKTEIDAVAIYPVVRPSRNGPRSLGMPDQFRLLFDFNRKPGEIRIHLGPQASSEPPRYVIHDNDAPSSPLPVWIEFEPRSSKSFILEVPRLPLISSNPQDGSSLYGCMLAEVEIYSGEVNVARGAQLTASDSLEREAWGLRFLNDERTPLGQPESNEAPPVYRGYQSSLQNSSISEVSIEYQWSSPIRMDAIRLHPAKPDYWNEVGGFGFPRKFVLRIDPASSATGGGAQWKTVADHRGEEFPNPANNDITFPLDKSTSVSGIQLTATLLAPELADLQQNPTKPKYLLALAEMSALREGTPLPGPDAIVTSAEALDSHWAPDGLMDGFTSTGRIISARRWASDLSQRRVLTGRISQLEQNLNERIHQQNVWISIIAAALIAALLLIVIINWTLSSRRRNLALTIDRERIANDLHDEVGGALGSISLLSQKLLGMTDDPEQRALLDKVRDAASEARAGVREAVWATGASSVDNKTFENHLRTIAERMLPDCDIDWKSNGSAVAPTFAPRKQHHFGMFFREAIHNIQKHARASNVSLRFQWNPRNMTFTLSDNGEGLRNLPASSESFRTLRYRAEQLPAKLEINPNPEGGTCFTLTTPLT